MTTRRSTRARPAVTFDEPQSPIAFTSMAQETTKKTVTKAKGKGKATRAVTSTHAESSYTSVTAQGQSASKTPSRAAAAPASSKAPAVQSAATRTVRTRSAKAASGSPLRTGDSLETGRKRNARGQTRSQTQESEPAQTAPAQIKNNDDDDDDDEQEPGLFFSESKNLFSSFASYISSNENKTLSVLTQTTPIKAPAFRSVVAQTSPYFPSFFVSSHKAPAVSSSSTQTLSITADSDSSYANFILENENAHLQDENIHLSARIRQLESELEGCQKYIKLLREVTAPASPASPSNSALWRSFINSSPVTGQPAAFQPTEPISYLLSSSFDPSSSTTLAIANNLYPEFDNDMMQVEVQPEFCTLTGSDDAVALLTKIENNSKPPPRLNSSRNFDERVISNNPSMQQSPQQRNPTNHAAQKATPARPIATPSSILSRSFSALKSFTSLFSTPKPSSHPDLPRYETPDGAGFGAANAPEEATPVRSSHSKPAPNTLTEFLSLPPTPVGERVRTSTKKRKTTDRMLETLLKGVEDSDRAKAEQWAKDVLPALRNDCDFREKRKRLQTPVLVQDLATLPSSKPWETGFGFPLDDLDEEDTAPVWAVYLDMMTLTEEPKTKKTKMDHETTMDDDDTVSINDLFTINGRAPSTPKFYDSNGHSTSRFDYNPRPSNVPSPMFDTPVSHQKGGNIFSENQEHDFAAKTREHDREILQNATNESVNSGAAVGLSFSVPDEDSDDEGVSEISEGPATPSANATSTWTQAPPPAPVPAHAALPASGDDASSSSQAIDEIERQRQKALKHTPAKPSRLHQLWVMTPPDPPGARNSQVSTPVVQPEEPVDVTMFDDIPDVQPLDIDDQTARVAEAYLRAEQEKTSSADAPWTPLIVSYDSDDESPSP